MTQIETDTRWHRIMAAADALLKAFHSASGRRSMINIRPSGRPIARNATHGPYTLNEYIEGMALLSRLGMVPSPVSATGQSPWTPVSSVRNQHPSDS